jgi:hypothetical protein
VGTRDRLYNEPCYARRIVPGAEARYLIGLLTLFFFVCLGFVLFLLAHVWALAAPAFVVVIVFAVLIVGAIRAYAESRRKEPLQGEQ